MCPGDLATVPEIVGVGLGFRYWLVGLEELKGNTVLLGVSDCLFERVELETDLAAHVGRRRPTHQRLDLAWNFRLVLQEPLPRTGLAGLHRIPGRLINTCKHSCSPLKLRHGLRERRLVGAA